MDEEIRPNKEKVSETRRRLTGAGLFISGLALGATVGMTIKNAVKDPPERLKIVPQIPSRDGLELVDKTRNVWMDKEVSEFLDRHRSEIGFEPRSGALTITNIGPKRDIFIKSTSDVKGIEEIRLVGGGDGLSMGIYYLKADLRSGFSVNVYRDLKDYLLRVDEYTLP